MNEARSINEEYRGRTAPVAHAVRMNLVVTSVPFGTGSIDAHVDTSSGEMEIEVGHLPAADVTLTVDYETAKAILVDQNAQAAMSAFMGGRIKVDGDLSKMLVLQGQMGSPDAIALEVAGRIRAVTA
jgi:putative sterol carrier protein